MELALPQPKFKKPLLSFVASGIRVLIALLAPSYGIGIRVLTALLALGYGILLVDTLHTTLPFVSSYFIKCLFQKSSV